MTNGKLFIVGTPIGNLSDITFRAVETLKHVHRILAEDTRHSKILLSHLGISGKPMASIEAHVSDERLKQLLAYLEAGEALALVTDAGMPAVSDPGARFVSLVRGAGFPIEVIPGPSAVTSAIALSGLVEGPFYFAGFLPRQGGKRTRALERVRQGDAAAVLFESPNRLRDTLEDLAEKQPQRHAAICRELTKLHEEVVTGTLAELALLEREWRGEIVVVLACPDEADAPPKPDSLLDEAAVRHALENGKSVRDLADESGLSGQARRALYARLLEISRK
jgi:16S rRNA (cytidine1402-2'-O)-methyltransferase